VAETVLSTSAHDRVLRDFDPYGYDERQFGSPGIDIPVGRLSRVPNGEYPEYHTSADNLDLIDADTLAEALGICLEISREFDAAEIYRNLAPKGEPQLGKRGLYRQTGGDNVASDEFVLLWVLNLSDGEHSLADIAAQSGLSLESLRGAAKSLVDAGLLEPV
jgi:aminopeptidase-like protein